MSHVPYKGMSAVVNDLLGGHIDLALVTPQTISAHADSAKIRIIAVTGSRRSPLFPNLPTLKESGLPEVVVETWFGVAGPANLPPSVTARLQNEIAAILKDPEVIAEAQDGQFRALLRSFRGVHEVCRGRPEQMEEPSPRARRSSSRTERDRDRRIPHANIPDGLVAVVKRDCPTCVMVEPVLRQLAAAGTPLTVLTQDDPAFPADIPGVVDDTGLERSFALDIEIVPTLLRIEHGRETTRAVGWHRGEWEQLTGVRALGPDLPEQRPGCGSLTADPNIADELAIRLGGVTFESRIVEIGGYEDDHEACFDRDWTDGLPVVPPTEVRVHRMLQGTTRDPQGGSGSHARRLRAVHGGEGRRSTR